MPTTRSRRGSGQLPIGVSAPSRREHLHRIADRDAERCREILAEHDAGEIVVAAG